jgi:branched-chain amino acid transport system ATP-binding protein
VTNEILLRIQDLSASYRFHKVLHAVSLTLAKHEIVSILGPNQSGKSTLLLCVMGLIKPSEGTIEFAGQQIVGHSTSEIVRLGIAIVPERRQIFASLSVKENLEIGALSSTSLQTKQGFERVGNVFPILRSRLKQRAGTLSGGEQQMLSIGRALMSSPRLLVLDEPALGLAPKAVEGVSNALRELAENGIAILMAEQVGHDTSLSAKRTLRLVEGTIL